MTELNALTIVPRSLRIRSDGAVRWQPKPEQLKVTGLNSTIDGHELATAQRC